MVWRRSAPSGEIVERFAIERSLMEHMLVALSGEGAAAIDLADEATAAAS